MCVNPRSPSLQSQRTSLTPDVFWRAINKTAIDTAAEQLPGSLRCFIRKKYRCETLVTPPASLVPADLKEMFFQHDNSMSSATLFEKGQAVDSPPELNVVHFQRYGGFLLREDSSLRGQWQPVIHHRHMLAEARLSAKLPAAVGNCRVKRLTLCLGGLGSRPFAPAASSGLVLFVGSRNGAYGDLRLHPVSEARVPNASFAAVDKISRGCSNVGFSAPGPLRAHEAGVDWTICQTVVHLVGRAIKQFGCCEVYVAAFSAGTHYAIAIQLLLLCTFSLHRCFSLLSAPQMAIHHFWGASVLGTLSATHRVVARS